eukprot:scaffold2361_cov203-Alexandrium_tamarense.AAC.13
MIFLTLIGMASLKCRSGTPPLLSAALVCVVGSINDWTGRYDTGWRCHSVDLKDIIRNRPPTRKFTPSKCPSAPFAAPIPHQAPSPVSPFQSSDSNI